MAKKYGTGLILLDSNPSKWDWELLHRGEDSFWNATVYLRMADVVNGQYGSGGSRYDFSVPTGYPEDLEIWGRHYQMNNQFYNFLKELKSENV